MGRYVARRLLLMVPVVVLISMVVFFTLRVLPGDVAVMVAMGPGGFGSIDPEKLQELRQVLGTDRPIYEQYLRWVQGLLQGDAGVSLRTGRPVFSETAPRLQMTLEMAVLTVLFSLAIAIPVGVLSAARQDTWTDYLLRVVSVGGLAVPPFWTGILIILVLVIFFDWLPPLGYKTFQENPFVNLQQMLLPSLALGYYFAAVVARMTRSCMLEVFRQDYIRTARAKGLGERVVTYGHALKNALLPVVTIIGLQFGTLLSGIVTVEAVFVLPGIGLALVQSITFRDYTMVQAIIMLFAIAFALINLLVDVVYAWLDPRITYA